LVQENFWIRKIDKPILFIVKKICVFFIVSLLCLLKYTNFNILKNLIYFKILKSGHFKDIETIKNIEPKS